MSYKQRIKTGFDILSNPRQEFEQIKNRTLEGILEDYIKLLLLSGLLAAVMSFTIQLAVATYLSVFKGIRIEFLKLANYSIGTSVSTFFIYLFFGTVIVFLLTAFLQFFSKKAKYTKVVCVTLYGLTPFLFFSWIYPPAGLALIVWCTFLIVSGLKVIGEENKQKMIKKNKK